MVMGHGVIYTVVVRNEALLGYRANEKAQVCHCALETMKLLSLFMGLSLVPQKVTTQHPLIYCVVPLIPSIFMALACS